MKEVIENVTFQTSTPASNWSTSTTSVGSPVSACVSPQVVSDDVVCLLPGSNVEVPRRKLNSLRTANPSVYIGDLAVLVYGRETLSHSSLTGRQSGAHKDVESKPQLDNTKLDAIIASPDVHVFAKKLETESKKLILTCLATGFYPKDVVMSLRKSKSSLPEHLLTSSGVRPNEDGTYQLRKSVEILEDEAAVYDLCDSQLHQHTSN
ncbi:hypothetical protein SRHO_G00100400 [Serrasalmus rhombeus]